jgi:hypothetical protein
MVYMVYIRLCNRLEPYIPRDQMIKNVTRLPVLGLTLAPGYLQYALLLFSVCSPIIYR